VNPETVTVPPSGFFTSTLLEPVGALDGILSVQVMLFFWEDTVTPVASIAGTPDLVRLTVAPFWNADPDMTNLKAAAPRFPLLGTLQGDAGEIDRAKPAAQTLGRKLAGAIQNGYSDPVQEEILVENRKYFKTIVEENRDYRIAEYAEWKRRGWLK
jgi:hypothetical protein